MNKDTDFAAILEALSGARVLVVGDVMYDRFIYGTVERISPEGPVPVLHCEEEAAMLGGAGNVLRNLCALGVGCDLVAVVGEDVAGDKVQELAQTEAGPDCQVIVQPDRPTTIKERYVANGQQLLRVDRETSQALAPKIRAAILAKSEAALPTVGALVLSDYGKGVLDASTTAALIKMAEKAGCPIVVDPKGRDFTQYRGASIITPNRRELEAAAGLPTESLQEVALAAQDIIDRCGIAAVLTTRGPAGMTLLRAGGAGEQLHLPTEAREVFDVSGAGDTVVAVVAAALAAGLSLDDAARLANAAAGVVVAKSGTAVAAPGEILRRAWGLSAAEEKIVDLNAMNLRAAQWRREGRRLGFTNGCFDLLHPGHISLLQQARESCDHLIVGLNSDASVRALKGEGRPVQSESARAAVLASLASVDLVVVFAEDTPLALIETLKPDVLVKGADYSLGQVVGREIVEGYGGEVVLAKLAQGYSTTGTIRKVSGGEV